MPTLFKLLLQKCRHMGHEQCKMHLDTLEEIYMMAVLNFKMSGDKNPDPAENLVKHVLK